MARTKQDALPTVIIEVPLGAPPAGQLYEAKQATEGAVDLEQTEGLRMHIQAQLGPRAAAAFLRMRNGLRERNERLECGRPVWTNVDALRWMLERVAEQV